MKNYSQDIMDYAALHPYFSLQDLYAHLDGEADISRQTISWYLTKLTESGRQGRQAAICYCSFRRAAKPERNSETSLAVCQFLHLRW